MYLVLSALTSSPVSKVAATKASAFSFGVCPVHTGQKYIDTFALPGCEAALIWLVGVVSGGYTLKTGRIRCSGNVGKTENCTAQQP